MQEVSSIELNIPPIKEKVKLRDTGIYVSPIGFGTGTHARDGLTSDQTREEDSKLAENLRFAYEKLGINLWDTASTYGSYKYIRNVLEELDRESVIIINKTYAHHLKSYMYDNVRNDTEKSMRELGVDYIDIMLLHCIHENEDEEKNWPKLYSRGIDALIAAKKEGLARAIGISCHTPMGLERVAEQGWIDVVLAPVNPYGNYSPDMRDVDPNEREEVLVEIYDEGKIIFAMKVLGEGGYAGDPEKRRKCIEYVYNLGCVHAMIIGMMNEKEILDNVALYHQIRQNV